MSALMDIASITQDWASRGFSCDVWTDQPGQAWKDYVHSVDELVMLIDGEIEVSFGGKTLRPSIGEEVFIPTRVSHTVINIGNVTNHWFYGYRNKA